MAASAVWLKSLLPFVVMCFGGFMALLDIQIVASSLQQIGGGLSAAQDEISWVQTAYLIAEIIVIPPENATGNFTKIVQRVPVRIALDDARFGELRPGLSTTVSIDTRPEQRKE